MEGIRADEKTNAGIEKLKLFTTNIENVTTSRMGTVSHEAYKLMLVNRVGLQLLSSGKVILIVEPCLLFLPPLFAYRWKLFDPPACSIPMIVFDNWLLDGLFRLKSNFACIRILLCQAARGLVFSGVGFEEYRQGFLTIFDHQESSFERELAFLSYLFYLSGCPSQPFMPDASTSRDGQNKANQASRLGEVCDYIRANYHNQLSQRELAGVAHLSISAFSDAFSKSLGCTFTEYLNRVRIEQACVLLQETNETVIAISHDCGFQTLSHFCERFRRLMKMTPSEYRAGHGGGSFFS